MRVLLVDDHAIVREGLKRVLASMGDGVQFGEATKQRIRRRNLWKRLLKRYPMFLETYYQEAVEARPEYYGSYTPGEFADVVFARGRMGSLKMVREGK